MKSSVMRVDKKRDMKEREDDRMNRTQDVDEI